MKIETYTLLPVQKKERIQLLDVIRGFAILGIYIMNLHSFTFYFTYTDAQKATFALAEYDHITTFLQHMLVEGKFYSLFSLLFGIGFSIYLSKANDNNRILSLFKRRLLVLLCIGFFHLVIWIGDIVAFYALLGFVLISFRKLSDKKLVIISICCFLLPIPLYALKMWQPTIFNPAQYIIAYSIQLDTASGITSEQDFFNTIKGKDVLKMLQLNLHGMFWRFGDLLFQDRIFKVFGMFLLGLVIGRNNIYKNVRQHTKLLKQVVVIGLVVGLPANLLVSYFMEKGGYYQLTSNGLYQTIAYSIGVAPLALAYAAVFALVYQNRVVCRFLNKLAPVGRMALTNYIMHSLIGIFMFTQLGFGIQNIGPTAWTLFAVGVFLLQIFTSTLWLHFFNYGPLEWIWRSATYGKWQPLLKVKETELSSEPVMG